MTPPPLVIGLGENSIDYVYRLPRYPQPGTALSKLEIRQRDVRVGGQVATTMATCARLGLQARYIGAFGSDEGGRRVREALASCGVDVSHAIVRNAPNRYAVILLDASTGERVVLYQRDERLTLTARDIHPDWLTGTTLVHVDATDPDAAVALARLARGAGLPVTCDIDAVTPGTAALLDAVTLPIVAEHLPEAMTGEADVERALRAMRRPHQRRIVVTLGTQGSAMLDDERFIHVDACPVNVVDSTGAGDVFRGALIHALLRGDAPEDMLRFANAAAAVSCTRAGALNGVPTPGEIDAALQYGRVHTDPEPTT